MNIINWITKWPTPAIQTFLAWLCSALSWARHSVKCNQEEKRCLTFWKPAVNQWWSSLIGSFGKYNLHSFRSPALSICHFFVISFFFPFAFHLRLTPIGVFFLVTAKTVEMVSLQQTLQQLGWYFFTVMLGLMIHGFGTISVIFFFTCRRLPFSYISRMGQTLATAFGTGSRWDAMTL